jgi:hypothetical protein
MTQWTTIDLIRLIRDIVSYGDDPFEEGYTELVHKYRECTDEEEKKLLEELIELLDILYKRMFR